MTYHHKRDPCSKDPREIIHNIFCDEQSNHELQETQKTGTTSRVSHDDIMTRRAEDENNGPSSLEKYLPPRHLDFEATEAKESFEKKKKRRNYMEFRPDYTKG